MLWFAWMSVAMANGPMVWKWSPTASVSYHLETVVDTPRGRRWYAEENESARATKQMLLMDITCVGEPKGKKATVSCDLTSVEFRGAAVPGEEETLAAIMAHDAKRLQGSKLILGVRNDGRILSMDLDSGVPLKTSRSGQIMGGLRQMIERAMAPLDVQLPKDGVDKGKAWKHKGMPLSMKLMTDQGTSGSVSMKHRVTRTEGGVVRLESTGRGTVAEGAMMEQGTSTMMHVTGSGRAAFNTAVGAMDWSEVAGESTYAAANLEGIVSKQRSSFSSWAARVDESGNRIEPTAD